MMTHTCAITHRDAVSISQYFRCQSCVWCHALWVAEEGAGWQQRTRRGEALPDKPAAPFNTRVLPVMSLYISVWVPGSSWPSQQLSPCPPPTQSLLSQHSAHFTLKLAAPRGWPALSPLCDSDCLSSLWMILLGFASIDPSCHPGLHPWPPSVAWDPWRGWRFKWFFYTAYLPVCPVSWLLMTTLERSIMEISKHFSPWNEIMGVLL